MSSAESGLTLTKSWKLPYAGAARIEITKIRGPCSTLDVYGPAIKHEIYDKQVQAGDPASPRWGLSGFYASVVECGSIRVNDEITLEAVRA